MFQFHAVPFIFFTFSYSTAGFGMDFIDLGDAGIMGYSFGYGNEQVF